MDNLYLLLITNRASNIVEDLETLRLLSKGNHKMEMVFIDYWMLTDNWLLGAAMGSTPFAAAWISI